MAWRLIIDTLIAAMLVVLLATILLYHRSSEQTLVRSQQAHQALSRLHEQTLYHGAVSKASKSRNGFPLSVSPAWFRGEGLPMNPLVPGRHAWMDIAPPGDMHDHPPDPVIDAPHQAGLWYNPNRGIFRARVMPQDTPAQTARLYNQLNATSLSNVRNDPASQRQPRPHPIYSQPSPPQPRQARADQPPRLISSQ